jgi:cyclohexyl-isocyanide hydratase
MGIGPAVAHRVVGTAPEIEDEPGVVLRPDAVYEDLAGYDLLYVPGGLGTRTLVSELRAVEYLRSWGTERLLASVCTGALLLGRAGHLAGLRATTHHRALEALRPFCREVVADRRVVDEGCVVTAGGVASSLDLGLYLVEKYRGAAARERIAAQMEDRACAPA